MSKIKKFFTDGGPVSITISVVLSVLLVVSIVEAATTIGTNISTGGTLTVTGNAGIGTTTPAQKLSVAGIIYSGTGGFQFPDGTTQTSAASGSVNLAHTQILLGNSTGVAAATSTITILDNGNVGIGTTTPAYAINVVGDFDEDMYGSPIKSEMFFYPFKAAFRAGIIDGTQWDDANIGYYSSVGGGYNTTASGDGSTVGGGSSNTASNIYSTVGGGSSNTASGDSSTIGGGSSNTTSGGQSTVGGGSSNTASDAYSTIGGGTHNTASGHSSTVGGGWYNTAGGDYSWVGGKFMQLTADADNTFVWGHSDSAGFSIPTANAFLIDPNGYGYKVGIGTSTPTVVFQATTGSANATTTVEFGKDNQSKGTCLKLYDDLGTAYWCKVSGGAFACSTTSCE